MSSIAGIFLGRKSTLAPYQLAEINTLLAQIFDASTAQGDKSYGFYHALQSGQLPNYFGRIGRKFNSATMTDPWVSQSTRCIVATFNPDMATIFPQPIDSEGRVVVHSGEVANPKDILGRMYSKVSNSAAINRVLKEELWDTLGMAINRLAGSLAFAAYDVDRSNLVLYRDYQPLVAYFNPEWDAVIFASRDSYVPQGKLINLNLQPYTGLFLDSFGAMLNFAIAKPRSKKGVVIFSGGLDSVLLATMASQECQELTLLHFDYAHAAREQESLACETLLPELQHMNPKCHFYLQNIPMGFLKEIGGTLLTETDEKLALEGATKSQEWLPARNTLLVAIAASFCDSHDIPYIYLGLTLEEAGAYPDNTTEFVDRFNAVLDCSTTSRPTIKTPLANMLKKDIVKTALALDAPVELTWSCQEGGPKHCGKCHACMLRQSAFTQLGEEDLVEYVT